MICSFCRKRKKIKQVFFKHPTNPFLRLCKDCFRLYTYNSKPINISKLFIIDNRKDFTDKQFSLIIGIISAFNIVLLILMWITGSDMSCISLLCG